MSEKLQIKSDGYTRTCKTNEIVSDPHIFLYSVKRSINYRSNVMSRTSKLKVAAIQWKRADLRLPSDRWLCRLLQMKFNW